MNGDAIGTGFFRQQRRLHGVRVTGTPGLTQGGHMINIHS
jgi:hypothetical protein